MKRSIHIKGTELDLSTPIVMGILNVTPDSFSDGGRYNTLDAALKQADQMIADGASMLDIGGYSSRPGALDVSVQEELERVIGILEKIAKSFDVAISIDTFRSDVAREAVAAGASIVNDISAGEDDPEMLQTVAELNVPYIAMHKQGVSKTMQDNPVYENVVDEVYGYLKSKIAECRVLGIKDVIIDPGFGFGKTMEHNFALLRNLKNIEKLNVPILAGLSRKSMIYKTLNGSPESALNGTSFLHSYALEGGANILRAHDVLAATECIKLWRRINRL